MKRTRKLFYRGNVVAYVDGLATAYKKIRQWNPNVDANKLQTNYDHQSDAITIRHGGNEYILEAIV